MIHIIVLIPSERPCPVCGILPYENIYVSKILSIQFKKDKYVQCLPMGYGLPFWLFTHHDHCITSGCCSCSGGLSPVMTRYAHSPRR